MKRKILWEDFSDHKSMKMLKLNKSAVENMDISVVNCVDVDSKFNFQLTEK